MTTEEFITKAIEKHGDKYSYQSVGEIKNVREKILIKCNNCGITFEQRVRSHLNGHGCPECAKKKRAKAPTMTKEEFITKAKKKHSDKYDYSLVEITGNNNTKVKIKCNSCSTIFEQRIGRHLRGQGCQVCAGNKKMTNEEFIFKATRKHGDKYDYSFVNNVKNSKTKTLIKCNKCGIIFLQNVHNHLQGKGCPECAKRCRAKAVPKALKMSIEEFITKATEKHGNRYDYSLVDKIDNNRTKVLIKCNNCDTIFPQTVKQHLHGQGCPLCNTSHLEEQTKNILEENGITFEFQKRFPWLKNKREMPLDFYLPEYNIAIECQGEQHYNYRENSIFTKDIVDGIKERDKLKSTLCQDNGITLYYIKYNEDVKVKLTNILNEIT